jgi:hypothetical protein
MNCPNCDQPLSPEQITKLWSQLSASKRKVKTGGRNGGRPKKAEPQKGETNAND